MKIIKNAIMALTVFSMTLLCAGTHSFAEGAHNTYEKTFTYTNNSGKTFGATVTITGSREADWELTVDKENDETADKYVYYRLIAKGDPGDVIDVTVTSEYPDTLLGVTALPKINGNWKTGSQKTLFVTAEDNTITDSFKIGEDYSDLQISVCAYSKSFSSKKPGSMDIILTIETPLHTDVAPSDGSGLKFLGTIAVSILVLVSLAIFLGKRNARKAASKEK
ncbi:MAG: hypothetical protein IKZ39_03325 [Lachnospiraceae bacterium]|nr:hypothetical protein [Lachnospiraceae bacterium]